MKNDDDVTFKGLFLPLTTKKVIIFLFIIGFLVFFNSLFNGFVGDDDAQIVKNLSVHSISNIPQFFTSSTFYNGSSKLIGVYYKPLLTSFFATVFTFFGGSAFMFHLIQVIFHILNASLLFLVLNKFFKKSHAFLLSVIFLTHPFQGESVFYVSAMQEILFFFFGILALLILIDLKRKIDLISVLILLMFSIFSKETGILFFVTSFLYLILFNRKFLKFFMGGSMLLLALYFLLRVHSIGFLTIATSSPIDTLSLPLRLLNVPEIILFYIKNFIFPLDFALTYQWAYTNISLNHFYFPLLVDLLFAIFIFYGGYILYKINSKKYFKLYIFFASLFSIGILFHMQIFPLDQTVADRWFYFPIIGILGMIGCFFETLKININNKWVKTTLIIVLIILSSKTVIRSLDWKDNLTLYSHDVLISKDSFALENVLGLEYMKRGKLELAKKHIEKSIELYPYFSNYDNLGEVYVGLGEYEKAKQAYLKALEFGDYYIVYEDLAGLTLVTGDYESNFEFIKNALSKFPKDARLWLYLSIITYQNGDIKIAKKAIVQSYLNDKNNTSIHNVYNSIMNNQPLNLKINRLPE